MANRRTTIEIPESKLHKQEQEKKRVEMFQTLNQSLASANKAVKHYLSIKVDGLWPNENTTDMGLRYCACHQYGEWKIIVPAALMNFDEEVIKGKEPYQLQGIYQSYINEMVDATIDVVVIAIDTASKRVLASRKMAMDYLEERNYFKEDKGGLSKIERAVRDNKNIESRVITVREKWELLDVLGHQVKMLVNDVNIINFDFSEAYNKAIEDKQVAEQKLKKAETDKQSAVVKAQAEAEKKKIAAEAEAAATKVKADAQAEANEKLNKSINKSLIDYEIANKWNGELPKVSGSNGTLINLSLIHI